ncbi:MULTISPECIES: shikimate kinase [Actinomycetes]|uniref:shikimate kinase n=1 Tax=Actinomycetes TaxID=1760 RepID=UPI000660F57B|nr:MULTISPECIES: shikimate kinase [Actinomycetes]MCM3898157.1 shikimate kinase [Schaalia meyeri]
MSVSLPIALVGLPGAGKSKVGRLLARHLNVPHIDTDAMIVERTGRSIAEIFASDGEAAFRQLEARAVADALEREAVISLGGGAVVTEAVRNRLGGHTVVYINATHDELLRRTGSQTHRPLLLEDPSAVLCRLREEREPYYRAVATLVVPSGPGPASNVAATILEHLELS